MSFRPQVLFEVKAHLDKLEKIQPKIKRKKRLLIRVGFLGVHFEVWGWGSITPPPPALPPSKTC